MTIFEPNLEAIAEPLPLGLEVNREVLDNLGSIALRAGQVLIGSIDPVIVNQYMHQSTEARTIAAVMCRLKNELPTDKCLEFAPIPGDKERIGLWIAVRDQE